MVLYPYYITKYRDIIKKTCSRFFWWYPYMCVCMYIYIYIPIFLWYCGWKKPCITLDGWNPQNNGINHLSTGTGFHNYPQYHQKKQKMRVLNRGTPKSSNFIGFSIRNQAFWSLGVPPWLWKPAILRICLALRIGNPVRAMLQSWLKVLPSLWMRKMKGKWWKTPGIHMN